jgi:crossover junction endodeoxyribonuclease RuvC
LRTKQDKSVDSGIFVCHLADTFSISPDTARFDMNDARSKILSIDPGLNGAWAVLGHGEEYVDMGELPRFQKLVSAVELGAIFRMHKPESCVIEKVGAMPGQGVTSVFTFGCAYGVAIGVAGGSDTPLAFVSPGRWKAHFRLTGKPKDASRELAIRLYPGLARSLALKKHHGRADALLLARFALDVEAGRGFV